MSKVKIILGLGVALSLLFAFSSLTQSTTAADSGTESRFIGRVQSLPVGANLIGDWRVNCRTVHVGPATAIDQSLGRVHLGAFVAVAGSFRTDGSFEATKVSVVPLLVPMPLTCPPPSGLPTPTPSPRPSPPPLLPPCFDFFGLIDSLPPSGLVGAWSVSHRPVHVTSSTVLKQEQGPMVVGALVEVKGCLRTDGSLDASLIEVRHRPTVNLPPFPFFELFGAVNGLPPAPFIGDWNVGGRIVHVTAGTHIEPMFRPLVAGALVRVMGGLRNNGSIDANRIAILRNGDPGRQVNFFELFGTVQVLAPGPSFVGDWMVSGLTVHVGANTPIAKPAGHPLAVGARVMIVGTQQSDLSLNAARIVVMRPVNVPQNFVAQNYQDFLNREPDDGGLNFWAGQISQCGSDAACVENQRVNVSAAFFLSTEFQQTGYFVYRFYQASFGRQPNFVEFIPDTQTVAQNIGAGVAQLEVNKQTFSDDWVSHPAFTALYDGLTNAEYVDTLYANTGVVPGQLERDALVAGLDSGSETRGSALQQVADNPAFFRQEFNRAFVLMQYFGYLRRDPDQDGYDFWVNIMNQVNGDFRQAQMVKAFIESAEYNQRFGPQ